MQKSDMSLNTDKSKVVALLGKQDWVCEVSVHGATQKCIRVEVLGICLK